MIQEMHKRQTLWEQNKCKKTQNLKKCYTYSNYTWDPGHKLIFHHLLTNDLEYDLIAFCVRLCEYPVGSFGLYQRAALPANWTIGNSTTN